MNTEAPEQTEIEPEVGLSDNSGLLCCPFCGGDGDVWEESKGIDGLDEVWMVGCAECPAELEGARNSRPTKHFPDEKQKTIAAWNTRAV